MKQVALFIIVVWAFSVQAQNWFQVPTGTTKQLNTIDFPSNNVGYIGGNDSLLLKSTDGGQTWQELTYTGVTFLPGGEHIVQLDFVTENIGFMTVGPYTGAYKTTDGGQTWTLLPVSGNLCYTRGLYFTDENNGFIGGSGCFQGELINRMTNGTLDAATSPVTFDPQKQVSAFDFDGNFGLASSIGGRILRTTDGGNNWDTIPVPMNPSDTVSVNSILIIDDTLCYAAYSNTGTGFGLYISTDAGLTWEDDPNSMTFFYPDMMDLCLAGNGKMITCGKPGWDNTGLIFITNGVIQENMISLDHPLRSCAAYGDSVVFAAGENGYLVTNVPLAQLGLNEPQQSQTGITTFPNPATGIITLSIPEGNLSEMNYRVMTVSGSLVEHGTLQGSQLNTTHYAPGVYLLHITTGEQLLTTRIVHE